MGLIEQRVLSDHVYENIRLMIQDRILKPGEKVNKRTLEEQLGVSQTPINDALIRLAGEKIIEQRNRRGFFVRMYACNELIDLFAARAAIEGMAARLAVEHISDEQIRSLAGFFADFSFPLSDPAFKDYEKADREFHVSIIRYSGNELIQEINRQFGYIVRAASTGLVRPPEETIMEHQDIVSAIEKRDKKAAGEKMTEHFMLSRDYLIQHCSD